MSGVLMGRVFFVAWSTVASQLFQYGSGSRHHHVEETNHPNHDPPTFSEAVEDQLEVAEKEHDLITALPGLHYDPGFKQYSGYLTVDEKSGRRIFYWYMESQHSPENDPLVLWTNGGPGCSGLIGLGTEHGPFFFSHDGELAANPYSWNKIANMLYIEQPSGVGFSYSDTPKDYKTGDEKAASDNYQLILAFLQRFPERRANDFYISSESYGGHYMPQLTSKILRDGKADLVNFKGMLVGNPYADPFTNLKTQIEAMYAHGLLSWPHYAKWIEHCNSEKTSLSARCQNYLVNLWQEAGDGINPYALDYPICVDHPDTYEIEPTMSGNHKSSIMTYLSAQVVHLLTHTTQAHSEHARAPDKFTNPPWLPRGDAFRPCAEKHFETYLNRPDVVETIHAKLDDGRWAPCSSKVQYSHTDVATSQVHLYKDLVKALKEHDINIMVFSGDNDAVCSLAGTQAWIWDLGVKPKGSKTWLPWKVNNQTAGYLTEFKTHGPGSFTFATVHGAGHEVPLFRPIEALELFRHYLDGSW